MTNEVQNSPETLELTTEQLEQAGGGHATGGGGGAGKVIMQDIHFTKADASINFLVPAV